MKKLWQFFSRKKRPATITIVSGLPRSGTSMMMKMLEAGGLPPLIDGIRTSDDDNPKGYYEFERVKKLKDGDTAWLPEAQGKVVKIISALLTHLPGGYSYQTIFMAREIPEILASQKKMLLRRGEDPNKVSDTELEAMFRKHLQHTYAWIERQPGMRCLKLSYNELLSDPATGINKICAFIDSPLDHRKMVEIIDPALYRQKVE